MYAPSTIARSASGGAAAQSSAFGHHWSKEVLGVVIVDSGTRAPEGDALLMDFAAAYRCAGGLPCAARYRRSSLSKHLFMSGQRPTALHCTGGVY